METLIISAERKELGSSKNFLIILKEKGFKDIEVVTVVVSRLKKSDCTMMFGKKYYLYNRPVRQPKFFIFTRGLIPLVSEYLFYQILNASLIKFMKK